MERILTTHSLAMELLSKPDDFLTATVGETEYVIRRMKRMSTHTNIDDTCTHLTLICEDGGQGFLKQ